MLRSVLRIDRIDSHMTASCESFPLDPVSLLCTARVTFARCRGGVALGCVCEMSEKRLAWFVALVAVDVVTSSKVGRRVAWVIL